MRIVYKGELGGCTMNNQNIESIKRLEEILLKIPLFGTKSGLGNMEKILEYFDTKYIFNVSSNH